MRYVVSLMAAALIGTSMVASYASAQELKLKISAENALAVLDVQMAQRFAEILKEELGDDFEYELFHTGALGNAGAHVQMIRTGQIDVYPMGGEASEVDPSFAVFDMPFLFQDRQTVARLLDGEIGEEFRKSLREKAGLELLAFGEIGFRQIVNNVRPIVNPSDLNGVKIRVPGSQTRLLAFQTFGASPVTLNLGETYLGLQQGTVDGGEWPLGTIKSASLDEVTKYLSMSNHLYTPVTLVMNGARYDGLTPEQQALVKRAAQEAALYTRNVGADADISLLKVLGETMEINEVDTATFRAAAEPFWDTIVELAGADFAEKVAAAAGE